MTDCSNQDAAIELLQQLGLKEYESRAFVVLSRLPQGTAKDVSELSDVPRTRVYDAVRVLESKGLVEIQHTNPQQFRAVSVGEASETLRKEYEQRVDSLRSRLDALEPIERNDEFDLAHEVWSLSGEEAIATRTTELVSEADDEVVLFVDTESALTAGLVEALELAVQRGVTVTAVAPSETLRETIADALPDARLSVSKVPPLLQEGSVADDVDITRLLLVDRSSILVSTRPNNGETTTAIFGRGFTNGLVTLVIRLLSAELDER